VTAAGPPRPSRISAIRITVAVLGLALLIVSVRQAGWNHILASISSVGGWLVAVVALGAARMAMRARAWTICSRADHADGIPFTAAFAATLAADALGNLTPLGLLASEPAKVMMGRQHVPIRTSLSSVAVENGFYTASVLAMLLGGVWVLLQSANVPVIVARAGQGVVVASMVATLFALWMFRRRPALLSRTGTLLTRLRRTPTSTDALLALEESVYNVVRWPAATLVHVATWEALFHVAAVAEVWLILRTMPGGERVSVQEAFLLETAGRFITVAFKFIPYRLGVDEIGSGSVSQLLGLGSATGVALALVRRVRILLLNAVGIVLLARSPSGERITS
jgi:hypothetical protein